MRGFQYTTRSGRQRRRRGAKISIVFVPARFFLGAATEALEAGIKLLVAIPEHVPVRDTMRVLDMAGKNDAIVIGPNTPGIMIPETIKVGIMPPTPFKAGRIAVLSKSGTLLYEISDALDQCGLWAGNHDRNRGGSGKRHEARRRL